MIRQEIANVISLHTPHSREEKEVDGTVFKTDCLHGDIKVYDEQ